MFIMGQEQECEEDADEDGWTVEDGDCNDQDETTHPGAQEVCDNRDNDCDGEVDEDIEAECPCGTGTRVCDHGTWIGDCGLCVPGTWRWCDEPTYCGWGQQVCGSDGYWGACEETTERPPGCESTMYDTACCVEAGECCQDYAHGSDTSVGDCEDECVI